MFTRFNDQNPPYADFQTLVRAKWRVSAGLSALMIVAYFGFMALFAFDKPVLALVVAPGWTLAMILGPALIILSFLLSLVYIVWTSTVYDPAVLRLQR